MKRARTSKTGLIVSVLSVAGIAGAVYCVKELKGLLYKGSTEGRYRAYYRLAFEWLMKKNEGGCLGERLNRYFNGKGINTIAIYGSGTLGELFYSDVKNSDIKVTCFIDKDAADICAELDNIPIVNMVSAKNHLPADAIIVTPVFDFDEIKDDLEDAGFNLDIISLNDIIHNV